MSKLDTRYSIVLGDSIEMLETEVEDALASGWILQGGVSVVKHWDTDNHVFYQAVILENPDQD